MLKKDQVRAILGNNQLFKDCSDETIAALTAIAVELNLEQGQVIYRPGDKAVNVYVLVEGIVTFLNRSGLEFLNNQRVIEQSMIFGWAALVPEHARRIGTAQCLENSQILSLDGARVLEILDADPQSGYPVLKTLTAMITSTMDGKP